VHISENDRGVPGTGHVDFPGIVAALKASGYDGYLMIEGFGFDARYTRDAIWRDHSLRPEDVAVGGARYLRGLLRG
jgi:D-psicose/D-tagatose/L-ribulose 3-epimerase